MRESSSTHRSDADLGWEAAIPWEPKDRTYAWRASDGTWRYTDWGRPYEALNSAYTLLSIFDALNPDAPLASYNIEAEKIKYIARYFDCGLRFQRTRLPDNRIWQMSRIMKLCRQNLQKLALWVAEMHRRLLWCPSR
jgi:hypothetical protein